MTIALVACRLTKLGSRMCTRAGFELPSERRNTPYSPRGELGYHVVSDGGTRPFRVHVRDPSFVNLQATAAMSEGGMIADVIAAIASLDPVMGGVDR